VWILIIGIGICSLSFEITPIEIIKFAQVANGLLLPIIAIFLLWIVNKSAVLGNFKNTIWHNILGMLIIGLALLLGAKSIFKVFGLV
jgi:Mn2+/Fe2+ NRAMP family transporter